MVAERQRSESTDPDVHTPKYAFVDDQATSRTLMKCTLPPHHPLSFNTYVDYETHYQQDHTNRCEECGNNFPTAHFINLHITENHDPIIATKRDAGEKTYACFVEDCDKLCNDWKKRRSHLVDKHGFPRNYDFLVVDHGIDHRRSMLRAGVNAQGHRRSSRERQGGCTAKPEAIRDDEPPSADGVWMRKPEIARSKPVRGVQDRSEIGGNKSAVDDLTSSFSSLKMVPRSVTFGRRKGRSGLAKS